jgi:hypothetical protein
MAAIPPRMTENLRRTSSENRAALSYGRGGAGRFTVFRSCFLSAVATDVPCLVAHFHELLE